MEQKELKYCMQSFFDLATLNQDLVTGITVDCLAAVVIDGARKWRSENSLIDVMRLLVGNGKTTTVVLSM